MVTQCYWIANQTGAVKCSKFKKKQILRKWMRKNCSIILLLASKTDAARNPQNCIFFVLLLVIIIMTVLPHATGFNSKAGASHKIV